MGITIAVWFGLGFAVAVVVRHGGFFVVDVGKLEWARDVTVWLTVAGALPAFCLTRIIARKKKEIVEKMKKEKETSAGSTEPAAAFWLVTLSVPGQTTSLVIFPQNL
ncbi:unnamed protein product [Linum trigynum]